MWLRTVMNYQVSNNLQHGLLPAALHANGVTSKQLLALALIFRTQAAAHAPLYTAGV
jgi:hypothetical protein